MDAEHSIKKGFPGREPFYSSFSQFFTFTISCWVGMDFCQHRSEQYLSSLLRSPFLSRILEASWRFSAKRDSWQPQRSFSWQSVLVKCIPPEMDRTINCLFIGLFKVKGILCGTVSEVHVNLQNTLIKARLIVNLLCAC